jgi:hypothetical protein
MFLAVLSMDNSKGTFNAMEDPCGLAEAASQSEPDGPNEFGNYERTVNAGRIIGNASWTRVGCQLHGTWWLKTIGAES